MFTFYPHCQPSVRPNCVPPAAGANRHVPCLLQSPDHCDKLRHPLPPFGEAINHTLSFLLGRLGGFAASRFFGSRRSAGGLPGVRRSGLGKANTGLITVGELNARDL